MKNIVYIWLLVFSLGVLLVSSTTAETTAETTQKNVKSKKIEKQSPPSLQVHNCIEKYAKKYKIPRKYAFGIAHQETGYLGAFHWKYKPDQVSNAGALGPMQIMLATGEGLWPERKITKEMLLYDIDLNIESSMKLLRILYDKHKNWKKVFGAYNTGKPVINNYAIAVYNH